MPYSDGVYTPPTGTTTAVPGEVIRSAFWNAAFTDVSAALTNIGQAVSIEFIFRDYTNAPMFAGIKGYAEVPMALTINSWKIMVNQAGFLIVDLWKVPFAGFPPIAANSITGSAPPSVLGTQSNSSSILTGWTTTLNKGDILALNVNSNFDCQQATLSLECGRN